MAVCHPHPISISHGRLPLGFQCLAFERGQMHYQNQRLHYQLIVSPIGQFHNMLLSNPTSDWLGNVLVIWANNSWPPSLEPEIPSLIAVEITLD